MAVITLKPKDVEATFDLNFLVKLRNPAPDKPKPESESKDEEKNDDSNNR